MKNYIFDEPWRSHNSDKCGTLGDEVTQIEIERHELKQEVEALRRALVINNQVICRIEKEKRDLRVTCEELIKTMKTPVDFASLVDDAIALNKSNRLKYSDSMKNIFVTEWAKEFCTVRIDVGRQAGKTKYIKSRAGVNDLIITDNSCVASLYGARRAYTIDNLHNLKQWMVGDIKRCTNTIWLDEVNPRTHGIEWLYSKFASEDRTFVWLGA